MRKIYAFFLLLLGSLAVSAQNISGTITDENKEPLPGVSIVVQGTQTGAATDFDGKFTISGLSPGSYILEISFIGYASLERSVAVVADETTRIEIQMEPEASELDEVVVVGYGVQRKREVTGSIVSVKGKELTEIPTPSFETGLQGKAPGVQVVTGSGLAGSGSVVRIRGISSISAGGDPLYVVDGIPITQDYFLKGNVGAMNNNPLATLNPEDIESVEVLKDASANAIYGSRGANGVVLITTKRGKGKGTRFNFSTRIGAARATALPRMLNSSEYLQLYKEAWVNDGNVGTPVLPGNVSWEDAQNTNTDWVDLTTQTGLKQQYDFGVSHNAKKMNLYGGISHSNMESYLVGNSYTRTSLRLNADFYHIPKTTISVSTSLVNGRNQRVDAGWSGGLGAAMSTALPIYPVKTDEGEYFRGGTNPVLVQDNKDWRNRELRTINNLRVIYNPVKNLYLTGSGSFDYMSLTEDIFETALLLNQEQNLAQRYPLEARNWNVFGTASYDWQMDENSTWKFMLGTEAQSAYTQNYFGAQVYGAPGPIYDNPGIADTLVFDESAVDDEWTFASFFGRINYDFKKKYFAQLVFRADGSSKFGPNRRWGMFPAVSGGWILSEESWLRDSKSVSFLKLKGGFGISGNAALPSNRYQEQNEVSQYNYNGLPIKYPTQYENPDLGWETSQVIDATVEFGFFEGRLSGELSYYFRASRDVFIEVTLPGSAGHSTYWDNVAKVNNNGVELVLRSINTTGKVKWSTDFNLARNNNVVKSIGGYSEDAVSGGTNDTRIIVGQPIGTNFLVRYVGVDPETGAPIYLDINGNQTYTWDPDNRVPVGNVLPDAIGGMTNTFRWSRFDFSFLIVYTLGGNIYDSSSKRQLGVVTDWNMTDHIYDRWRQPGDEGTRYPRLTLDEANYGSTTPWINTDLWLHDGTFARLRNVTFGYSVSPEKLEKWKISNFRVYFVGTNLLTWTKFPGVDPEIARDFENQTDRNMSVSITYLTPPQEQTYNIGLQIGF
jgi:TonB-linked SusC/RagA family outer membrane protein